MQSEIIAAIGYDPEPPEYTAHVIIIAAGILGYLYVKGVLKMSWLKELLLALLRNNGTGTPSKEVDIGDLWDSIQVALIAAVAIGGEAMLRHLELVTADQTGLAALALGGIIFVGRLVLNYLSDNSKG